MTPYEYALARFRAYHLFGRLFLQGITANLLPQLQLIPELAAEVDQIDLEQAAADHYQLTAVSVFPFESIFLDPTGLLGGPVSDLILEVYRQSDYEVLSDADHIGHELQFMSHLCAAEASAYAAGNENAGALWHGRQQGFLSSHLLTWLAPLVVTIEHSESDYYGRLANLTLDLCADHLGAVDPGAAALTLPAAPDLTAEDKGLKEIARALNTPPYSGLFLSRDAISNLARRHSLPRGFGDRAQMLTNLLRTAGQYDAAAAVIEDLAALYAAWGERYQQQQETFPHLSPWIQPWQERVSLTAGSLKELTAVLEKASN